MRRDFPQPLTDFFEGFFGRFFLNDFFRISCRLCLRVFVAGSSCFVADASCNLAHAKRRGAHRTTHCICRMKTAQLQQLDLSALCAQIQQRPSPIIRLHRNRGFKSIQPRYFLAFTSAPNCQTASNYLEVVQSSLLIVVMNSLIRFPCVSCVVWRIVSIPTFG
jgi:hypothetical protein